VFIYNELLIFSALVGMYIYLWFEAFRISVFKWRL